MLPSIVDAINICTLSISKKPALHREACRQYTSLRARPFSQQAILVHANTGGIGVRSLIVDHCTFILYPLSAYVTLCHAFSLAKYFW